MSSTWDQILHKSLSNQLLSVEEANQILDSDDQELLNVVAIANQARNKFFGKRVKLNYLVNVKSGICPEDCHYCSQSKDSKAPIEKYPLMDSNDIISHVEKGLHVGAKRACLVASGRGPSDRELNSFCDSVKSLKEKFPELEVCACLGLLQKNQAAQLKEAGVFAYNHNLNTSKSHYDRICATHQYDDRIDTVQKAQESGLSSCSGVLCGMGETHQDLIETAFALRENKVESIPINFLISIDKTPLQNVNYLTPQKCLRILSLFRLVNPSVEIRIAGGREVHLRHLQPLGLMIANSIFIGDYLTTQGQSARADLEMIRDLGYEIEGQAPNFLNTVLGSPAASAPLKNTTPAETESAVIV